MGELSYTTKESLGRDCGMVSISWRACCVWAAEVHVWRRDMKWGVCAPILCQRHRSCSFPAGFMHVRSSPQAEFSTVCWQSKRGETWSKSLSSPPPSLYASINNKLYAVTFWRDRNRKCNSMFNNTLPRLTQIGTRRVDICCTQLGDLLLFKILAPLCFTDLPV